MKICKATGDICENCNHVPPKIHEHSYHEYSYGNICRIDVEDILRALEYGNIVCYDKDNKKFYERMIYMHPQEYMKEDGDWICLE